MTDAEKREKVIRGLKICVQCRSSKDCDGCPYEGERTYAVPCGHVLMADALALLKEQGPRVLAYPEIVSFDGVVWIETIGAQNVVRAICNGYVVTHDLLAFSAKSGSPVGMVDDYYKRWRCWTSRPTPEQMQDTPWEGDSDA